MICEFCENKFSSTSSLLFHQRTTKYCLAKQNKEILKKFTCSGCNSEFTRKQDFNRHISICKANNFTHEIVSENNKLKETLILVEKESSQKDKQIEDQKQQIKDLQKTIEKLASQAISRPTSTSTSITKNTQNNYIQQLQPIMQDTLKENAHNLTIEHIKKGAKGYAEYALAYPLKDRIACVDYSRRKVKFKDHEGNIITDPEMNNLCVRLFESIKDINTAIIAEYGKKYQESPTDFSNNMDKIFELIGFKYGVDNGANGQKEDFHHDFVRQICSKTIVNE
jgi:hypothetical protein